MLLIKPIHRMDGSPQFFILLSILICSAWKCLKKLLFNFENKITGREGSHCNVTGELLKRTSVRVLLSWCVLEFALFLERSFVAVRVLLSWCVLEFLTFLERSFVALRSEPLSVVPVHAVSAWNFSWYIRPVTPILYFLKNLRNGWCSYIWSKHPKHTSFNSDYTVTECSWSVWFKQTIPEGRNTYRTASNIQTLCKLHKIVALCKDVLCFVQMLQLKHRALVHIVAWSLFTTVFYIPD